MNQAISKVILAAILTSGAAQANIGTTLMCHSPLKNRAGRYIEFFGVGFGGTRLNPKDAQILESDIYVGQSGLAHVSRQIVPAKTYAPGFSPYYYVLQEDGESVTYSGTFVAGALDPILRKTASGTVTQLKCVGVERTIQVSALPHGSVE